VTERRLNDGVESQAREHRDNTSRKFHVFHFLIDETNIFLVDSVRPAYTKCRPEIWDKVTTATVAFLLHWNNDINVDRG